MALTQFVQARLDKHQDTPDLLRGEGLKRVRFTITVCRSES